MLTPQIDTDYHIVFKSPYDDVTRHSDIFTLKSIVRISDLLTAGADVWNIYYRRHNIAYAEYAKDIANNIYFYTLHTDGGAVYIVPSSFVDNLLLFHYYPYKKSILTIDLDVLPVGEDIEILKIKLDRLVKSEIGVAPLIYDHSSSTTINLTTPQHNIIDNSRNSLKEASPPWESMYHELLLSYERQLLEKKAVEDYLTICLACSACGVEEKIINPDPIWLDTGEHIFETEDMVYAGPCCDWTVSQNPTLFMHHIWAGYESTFFYMTDGVIADYNSSYEMFRKN